MHINNQLVDLKIVEVYECYKHNLNILFNWQISKGFKGIETTHKGHNTWQVHVAS